MAKSILIRKERLTKVKTENVKRLKIDKINFLSLRPSSFPHKLLPYHTHSE